MALRAYEAMLVFNPELDEGGLTAATQSVGALIGGQGGQVEKVDTWGRRHLYYAIKGCRDGSYVLIDFKAEAPAIRHLEANLRLREDVLRHLVVRKDD